MVVQVPIVPTTVYTFIPLAATLIVLPVAPVLHEYVFAPLADNAIVFPGHVETEFTVTVGFGLTVIEIAFTLIQVPFDVLA